MVFSISGEALPKNKVLTKKKIKEIIERIAYLDERMEVISIKIETNPTYRHKNYIRLIYSPLIREKKELKGQLKKAIADYDKYKN